MTERNAPARREYEGLSEQQKQDIVDRYTLEPGSIHGIAHFFRLSEVTVRLVLKEKNVPKKSNTLHLARIKVSEKKEKTRKGKTAFVLTEHLRLECIHMYLDELRSIKYIADRLVIPELVVKEALHPFKEEAKSRRRK